MTQRNVPEITADEILAPYQPGQPLTEQELALLNSLEENGIDISVFCIKTRRGQPYLDFEKMDAEQCFGILNLSYSTHSEITNKHLVDYLFLLFRLNVFYAGVQSELALNILVNISILYKSIDKHQLMLSLFEAVNNIVKNNDVVIGRHTINMLNMLANSYQQTDNTNEAINLYGGCLARSCDVMGEEAQESLATRNNLANCYGDIGEFDKALPMHVTCLEISEKKFGCLDRLSVNFLNNLATCHYSMGNFPEAFILHLDCLARRLSILEQDAPDTLTSLNDFVNCYERIACNGMVPQLLRKSITRIDMTLDGKLSAIITCIHGIGYQYYNLHQPIKALPFLQVYVEYLSSSPDGDVRTRLKAYNNLATCHECLGEIDIALSFFEKSLEASTREFGEKESITLTSQHGVAVCYDRMGEFWYCATDF